MLRWSINLFRVRGIQLAMHVTFPLIVAYFMWIGYNDPGADGTRMGMTGAVEAGLIGLAYFTFVILHEFGHSFTAMHFGIRVRRILLLAIGGQAEFERIPREPRQELLITVAGPAVNFVLAALLWAAAVQPHAWTEPRPGLVFELLFDLGIINLYIGLFNLLPAFPMDGGRIVRALLAYRLPYVRATFWAATVGKVVGVAGMIYAWHKDRGVLIALFLYILSVGELEYRMVRAQQRRDEEWAAMARRLESARREVPSSSGVPPLELPN